LRDIVETVNSYLADERDRLQKRAMVLSGVSHDLGTPATRLRLRTALIEDDGLREKLESDIDQMTDMIESVLTYTRAEMSAEETVRLSLTALVQSIVADYEDVGEPVQFVDAPAGSIEIGRSVFSGGAARKQVLRDDARRILVTARAISLRRAISNLIDNAVKYGRNAEVSVQADSRIASIVVTDSGQFMTEDELDTLVQPFLRGSNAEHVKGAGLGLTVVATIARQHGGTLRFERGAQGVRAIMTIGRR
jgi:signal transduction histidine kinase